MVNGWICSCALVVNSVCAHVQELSRVDMIMFSGGQWWICSCVEVANGEYAHVKKWSIVGYAHVH